MNNSISICTLTTILNKDHSYCKRVSGCSVSDTKKENYEIHGIIKKGKQVHFAKGCASSRSTSSSVNSSSGFTPS